MIKYRSLHAYKYQLMESYCINIDIYPPLDTTMDFVKLSKGGGLVISKGYSWDGPSGPSIDTPNSMRGSLVHDSLYQLMREGGIGQEYRKYADDLLYTLLCEDGMSRMRAKIWWTAVRIFAYSYARPVKK